MKSEGVIRYMRKHQDVFLPIIGFLVFPAHQAIPSQAHVNPQTGIIQMDAIINADRLIFALE